MPLSKVDKSDVPAHQSIQKTKEHSWQSQQSQPFQERSKEPAPSMIINNDYKGLLPRNDDHSQANGTKQESSFPTECSVKYSLPKQPAVEVALTQIDSQSANGISCQSQEAAVGPFGCNQDESCHSNGKPCLSAKDAVTKESTTESVHPKQSSSDGKQTLQNPLILQQASQELDDAICLTPSHPFSPAWAKELCQYSEHLSTELEQSFGSVLTISSHGNSMQESHSTSCAPRVINGCLDTAIIKEVDMLEPDEAHDAKKAGGTQQTAAIRESPIEANKDCPEATTQEQFAVDINATSHGCTLSDPVKQPAEHGTHIHKVTSTPFEDPIVPIVPDLGNLSSSITVRRILTHLHTLKQLVASKTSCQYGVWRK